MQGLQQSYTQYFNRAHQKVGHLFQGRYKAIICQKEEYLLELVRYVHLNPVRSKLVRRPEHYPYSGHRSYLEGEATKVIEPGPVLKLLGGRKGYRKFVLEGLGERHKDEYYEPEDQRFLGTQEFGEKVREQVQEEKEKKSRRSLEVVVGELAGRLKMSPELLRGPDRSWEVSRARGLVVYVLTRRLGFSAREVGSHFGRDATSVSVIVSRFSERMMKERQIKEDCERILKIV